MHPFVWKEPSNNSHISFIESLPMSTCKGATTHRHLARAHGYYLITYHWWRMHVSQLLMPEGRYDTTWLYIITCRMWVDSVCKILYFTFAQNEPMPYVQRDYYKKIHYIMILLISWLEQRLIKRSKIVNIVQKKLFLICRISCCGKKTPWYTKKQIRVKLNRECFCSLSN